MLQILSYLLNKGVVTNKTLFPMLDEGVRGLPALSAVACSGAKCSSCIQVCPTDAIAVSKEDTGIGIELDLGKCIGCGACTTVCPTGTIRNNRDTRTASYNRSDLILRASQSDDAGAAHHNPEKIFQRSIAVRVVSTGCSACDLEIGAATNPIFDMERFGIQIVASPRFADVLAVTGPVPKAMHEPLLRCYQSMAEPRRVVAIGTCAVSGGVHQNNYTEANGVDKIIPVDVYVPGCPPNPWSIIYAIQLVRQDKPS